MRGLPEVLRGCIALLILAVPSGASAAEWFLDLYGGMARMHGTQIEARDFGVVPPQGGAIDVDFGNSGTFGVRGGFWVAGADSARALRQPRSSGASAPPPGASPVYPFPVPCRSELQIPQNFFDSDFAPRMI